MSAPAWRWDLYARVIDNFGDVGVAWRLAADLARRGHTVRLWLDDARALAWMAPGGAPGVEVLDWHRPAGPAGDVVIELFGCDPPAHAVDAIVAAAASAGSRRVPVWINLEHLSAEPWVERSHGLPSPVLSGPAAGLTKWFCFPGFTPRTGGLLRETGLPDRWAASPPAEPRASVFCYAGAPVAELARRAGERLWLCPGPAQDDAAVPGERAGWLTQDGYDRLLQTSALNFVRGEDSFVRAQWAGQPFVWHVYPQHDGVHRAKLDAFLDLFLARADRALADGVRALWHAWNGFAPWPSGWPDRGRWLALCRDWRARLAAQPDLVTQLQAFVDKRR